MHETPQRSKLKFALLAFSSKLLFFSRPLSAALVASATICEPTVTWMSQPQNEYEISGLLRIRGLEVADWIDCHGGVGGLAPHFKAGSLNFTFHFVPLFAYIS